MNFLKFKSKVDEININFDKLKLTRNQFNFMTIK